MNKQPTNFEFLRGCAIFAIAAAAIARPDVREALGLITVVGLGIWLLWPEKKQ